MNEDGTSSLTGDSSTSSKMNTVMGVLSNKRKEDESLKPGFIKNLQDQLFPEEKRNRAEMRRLRQKQKTLQAVPIAIDSITPDGRREIRKTLQNIFSFKLDTKKPDEKSGPWAKLFFIIAGVIGFLVGAIMQVFKDLKSLFNLLRVKLKNIFLSLKNTKIGKAISGLFKSVKLKFLKALRSLKGLSIVKSISGFFKNLKDVIGKKFKSITSFASKMFSSIKGGIGSIFLKVKNLILRLKNFFKPITSLLGKFKFAQALTKPLSLLKGLLRFFGKLSGFFKLGMGIGRIFGKVLWPIFAIIEIVTGLFKAFTDPKLKDKSFIQKMITGLVAGIAGFFDIFSLFGLELFKFEEIRDRFDKIFSAFKDGFLNGIFEWLNQLQSFAIGLVGKIIGWIVGWFNKDAGKAITDWSQNFDLKEFINKVVKGAVKFVGDIFNNIVKFFTQIPDQFKTLTDKLKSYVNSLGDKISNFVKGIVDWIANTFSFSRIKEFFKEKLGFKPREREVEVKEAGDFVGDNDRTLYTNRSAYKFDKNDELMAIKRDGPITELLSRTSKETSKGIQDLTKAVNDFNSSFKNYVKTAMTMQQNELKIMGENMALLKNIGDRERNSNVIVQNNNNSNIFSEKASSNIDYRRSFAHKATFDKY